MHCLQFGFDGSLVADSDHVYVLSRHPGRRGVRKLWHFAHVSDSRGAMAQMRDYGERVYANEMINISKGFTVERIIHLQRRWRLCRSRRYETNMHMVLLDTGSGGMQKSSVMR